MMKHPKIINLPPTKAWLVFDDNPLIRQKALPIQFPLNDDDWLQISKMVSYIEASFDGSYKKYDILPGVAIASNQINWLKRVIYLHFIDEYNEEHQWLLANPIIKYSSEQKTYLREGEGCLSVPEHHKGIVPRHHHIIVEAINIFTNEMITIDAKGFTAIVLQHEIDHLDGKLYYDHINLFDAFYKSKEWKKI